MLINTHKIERTTAERTQASVISKGLSQVTGQERVTVLNLETHKSHILFNVCVCVAHTLVCMCAQECQSEILWKSAFLLPPWRSQESVSGGQA